MKKLFNSSLLQFFNLKKSNFDEKNAETFVNDQFDVSMATDSRVEAEMLTLLCHVTADLHANGPPRCHFTSIQLAPVTPADCLFIWFTCTLNEAHRTVHSHIFINLNGKIPLI